MDNKLEEVFDLLTSNKDYSLKLFVPPEGNETKYVYIDTKNLVIYINYLLPKESPESVLPAILFALSHLVLGTYLYKVEELEAIDYYVYERFLKRLGFDVIFDSFGLEVFGCENMNFEEFYKASYSRFSYELKEKIKELSDEFGRPYELSSELNENDNTDNSNSSISEQQSGEGSKPNFKEVGDLDWKDVIKQVSEQIKSEGFGSSSENSEDDSDETDSSGNPKDGGSKNLDDDIGSSKYGTSIETNLGKEDARLYSLLREFLNSIMDRGKKFRFDSMKHFNRKSRGNTNLIYTSISKKVLKSRDKWGILVDVSGSMPNKALCSILRVFSDDICDIIDPQSIVVTWDIDLNQKFLVSEVPTKFNSGGGTNLTNGIKYLEKLNCKRIMVYSDFEDSSCYNFNKAMLDAKNRGISIYCFSTQLDSRNNILVDSFYPEFSSVWRQVTKR